ncbi:MAG TPA: hypothetical protein VII92_09800 [Anaerolineae bacterium]
MMITNALSTYDRSRLRLTKRDYLRAVVAGSAFGLVLATGLTIMTAWQCGGVCVPEIALNTALSFVGGIFGIGPVAAYGGRR